MVALHFLPFKTVAVLRVWFLRVLVCARLSHALSYVGDVLAVTSGRTTLGLILCSTSDLPV